MSRFKLCSTSAMTQRRELPWESGSSPICPWTLVATTTLERSIDDRALPTISSDSPWEYTSAVSMKLIPASSALWMILIESSWSVLAHPPNIMAPRQRGLTLRPVRPRVRSSISSPYVVWRRRATPMY